MPLGYLLVLGKCFEVRERESLGKECVPYKEGQLAMCPSRAFKSKALPAKSEPIFVGNASEALGFLRQRGKLLFRSKLNNSNNHHHKQKQKHICLGKPAGLEEVNRPGFPSPLWRFPEACLLSMISCGWGWVYLFNLWSCHCAPFLTTLDRKQPPCSRCLIGLPM